MEPSNPNLTPEDNFTLTYFPSAKDAVPRTPLEEAIQYLFDCLPSTDEEIQYSKTHNVIIIDAVL